jgi:hypothetical protein
MSTNLSEWYEWYVDKMNKAVSKKRRIEQGSE